MKTPVRKYCCQRPKFSIKCICSTLIIIILLTGTHGTHCCALTATMITRTGQYVTFLLLLPSGKRGCCQWNVSSKIISPDAYNLDSTMWYTTQQIPSIPQTTLISPFPRRNTRSFITVLKWNPIWARHKVMAGHMPINENRKPAAHAYKAVLYATGFTLHNRTQFLRIHQSPTLHSVRLVASLSSAPRGGLTRNS
jgi:hypothetical protein